MNKSIYEKTLCDLLMAVDNFRAGEISLKNYQAEIFKAESEIESIDERELRSLLLNHENELELIHFTTGDKSSVNAKVDAFRDAIRVWI